MAKLVISPGLASRRELALSRASAFTIGRDPTNDLVLGDAMVSRHHAVVEYRAGRYHLRDCNSANGSLVNGHRVSERELRDGDQLAIGPARLLFRADAPESPSGKVLPHPSATPPRCPACASVYRRGDVFCRECGEQVGAASAAPGAVCGSCGAGVTLPARYCSACGRALGGDLQPAAAGEQAEKLPSTRPPRPREPAPLTRSTGSMAIASGLLREPLPAVVPGSLPSPAPQARGLGRDVELAEPGSRLAAALVDGVFVTFLQALLLAPLALYWWTREAPRAASEVSFLPVLVTLLLPPLALLLGALYHVYFWSRRGATPGMELLELRVESEDGRSPIGVGRAALRAFGYLLCLASLGVGFLMVVFGGGLHDRIARTRVVRARPR